nr:unnamed protein product [Callosobruchus chinensis]
MTSFRQFKAQEKHKLIYKIRTIKAQNAVIQFLERDECSRLTAGKKTNTRQKQKKQMRYLNDSLKNLHKQFLETSNFKKMSYQRFCMFRPFWIVIPSAKIRNTCLCKIHNNMALLITALTKSEIIEEHSISEVIKHMCCRSSEAQLNEHCLERSCQGCRENMVNITNFDETGLTSYETWITKRVELIIKGEKKSCMKTIKELKECSKVELLNALCNVSHQFRNIKYLKENLSDTECLLHMDFSENYNCKYAEESQISLHTSVFYYISQSSKRIESVCLCTLSENLRHDPVAICVHIEPIIATVKQMVPNLRKIHFLGDGPSTQYRNKLMFQ